MRLDDEVKARLTPEMKKQLKRKAREEAKKRGMPVTPSKLAREWIAAKLGMAA